MHEVLETLPDGCVKITLQQDGFTAIGIVSSYHLVEPKLAQLRADIISQALAAYEHP